MKLLSFMAIKLTFRVNCKVFSGFIWFCDIIGCDDRYIGFLVLHYIIG